MRPPIPDIPPSRSRKPSFEQPRTDPHNSIPATFFLSRSSAHDSDDLAPDESDTPRDSMYGVQSLDEAVQEVSLAASSCEATHSVISGPHYQPDDLYDNDDVATASQRRSTLTPSEFLTHSKLGTPLQSASDDVPSCPLTPFNLESVQNGSPSLPSSPKSVSNNSLKPLDDISITDELSSQAIASGEEDNDSGEGPNLGPDSISQLIMPSISMPSRRPFTERGKAMGRLKVVLAGAPGSGKTSLINSVVQACEDIVHIDPFLPPTASHRRRPSHQRNRGGHVSNSPPVISEFYASTKPYPPWWSDLEDSRVLRRRKSTGDIVLERNLCFVDTPANSLSQEMHADVIVQYIHQQLARAMVAPNTSVFDFQNMLAGNGGSQVDAILYLISEDTLATDIECMKKLCDLTNIIPVISKADLLSSDQVLSLKSSIHKQAKRAGVKPFLFGDPSSGEINELNASSPFAVSSAKSSDADTMDASTLMNPDYVQPLVPSELDILVQKLFDRDNVAWMRHSAAKKLAQRRPGQPYLRQYPAPNPSFAPGQSGLSGLSSSIPSLCSSDGVSLPGTSSPSYTLARITDYTLHEERKAQIHLAKWALDLQRSLQNERERYAALTRGDRAVWLTEQLKESVMDGSIVPITQAGVYGFHVPPPEKANGGFLVRTPNGQGVECHISSLSQHDPLGVVWWADDLKRRGWVIVQILGSFGVVGGLAFWLARSWGLPGRNLSEWNFHWCG